MHFLEKLVVLTSGIECVLQDCNLNLDWEVEELGETE